MVAFSKLMKKENNILTYIEFYKDKINLKKFKIPQLKEIAKHHKLYISGTKPILITRIETFFLYCKKACIIQKFIRGYFVRHSYILRGPAFKNRKLCVNETDFYTLEPLDEIPNEHFYSYRDNSNFIYGFSIISLMTMFKKNNKTINNPYNREVINTEKLQDIFKLAKLTEIVYYNKDKQNNTHDNANVLPDNQINTFIPRTNRNEIMDKINEIRNKPINVRIENLFIEIDMLGNYTQSSWFSNLQRNDYMKFYDALYFMWYESGDIPYRTRREISPYFEPFIYGLRPNLHPSLEATTVEQKREYCCTIIENIIYGSLDIEIRKIAVLHVLSVLTLVSLPARENLPWLYESISSIFI